MKELAFLGTVPCKLDVHLGRASPEGVHITGDQTADRDDAQRPSRFPVLNCGILEELTLAAWR